MNTINLSSIIVLVQEWTLSLNCNVVSETWMHLRGRGGTIVIKKHAFAITSDAGQCDAATSTNVLLVYSQYAD